MTLFHKTTKCHNLTPQLITNYNNPKKCRHRTNNADYERKCLRRSKRIITV